MPRGRKKKQLELPQVTPDQLTKPIGQIAEECYTYYGAYVNNFRAIANVADGMKVSYKRLIWAALQYPKGQDIPTMNLIASLSKWHPHGTTGCEGLNANLVNSGVFSGHGFFGNKQIDGVENPHAATRYTKNRLSDLYWGIIGDIVKEVPMIESPQGGIEPIHIPLPLPLCMYLKGGLVSGLGVGVMSEYPNFSPKSMFEAYKRNDPSLLEPNIDIFIDKANSELQRLWETGKGRVIYSYKISRKISDDGKSEGILFEGDTALFTPRLRQFKKLVEDGKIYIEDITDDQGPKLFVARIPGAKGITIEDIEKIARKCCYDATTYQLNVTNGETTFRIPLREWINYTYTNYVGLVSEVNKKRIAKCQFDIKVQEAIPYVADYILNKNPKASDAEIEKALGIPAEIIEVVMGKPISYLRANKDTAERVKALKNRLKELKAFDPVKYTEEIINQL